MKDHRIRLTDDDIALIVASLLARRATAGIDRRARIDRLSERLSEGTRGNPNFRRALAWERGVTVSDADAARETEVS